MPEVLFVDDEPFILDAYQRMLRNSAFQCHVLANSLNVVPYLKQHPIDIVVADQQMPLLSGLALLAELKQKFPAVKRVLISGNLTTIEQVSASWLDAVLEKPCSKAVLLARLHCLVTAA